MSYRSDVRFRLKKSDFEKLKKEYNKKLKEHNDWYDLFKHIGKYVEEKDYEYYIEEKDAYKKVNTIYFGWNGLKWYDSFEYVKLIMNFVRNLDCFSYARLGEELGDYECESKNFEDIFAYQGFDDDSE